MKNLLLRTLRDPRLAVLRGLGFFVRGLLLLGNRHQCPCCGWHLRAFVAERGLLRPSEAGYCPRCNAKARHRRIWLYLSAHTDLLSAQIRLLEVAPWWSFARRFQKIESIDYVGVDLKRTGTQVTTIGDLIDLPIQAEMIDVVLCIHVLEHISDDHQAIAELYRVLRPGGLAIISVPLRLDQPTLEDPSVQDPDERTRLFGEPGHVRYYGKDFIERLRKPGFKVHMDPADELPAEMRHRFGLRTDENIFHCVKQDRKTRKLQAQI